MQQDVSFRAAQGADDRRVGQVADERGIGGRAGEGPIRQQQIHIGVALAQLADDRLADEPGRPGDGDPHYRCRSGSNVPSIRMKAIRQLLSERLDQPWLVPR